MKKIISVFLVFLLSLSFVGCNKKTDDEKDLLTTVKERGYLICATEGVWAPWTYHDENDVLVGFDVEVAKAIGEKLGVEIQFVEGDFDGFLAGLDSKRYDMIMNGIDVTAERKEKYDFTDAYAYDSIALIVRNDNLEINSFEDLNGKSTANTLSSSYAAIAESYGAITTGVDTLDQTLDLVLAGRIDATLNSFMSFNDYLVAHPDSDLKVVCLADDKTSLAIPLRKTEETASLREAINQAIAQLKAEGVISQLSIKYFGTDISQK